jgi:secernin
MGSDAVVARRSATVDGLTLFGQNLHGPGQFSPRICLREGRDFVPGQLCDIAGFSVPQVKRTQSVLGLQPHNSSGYRVGLNSANVVAGCLPLEMRLRESHQGLTGPDLVRLILERSHSVCQAVETLASLIDRHGQGGATGEMGMAGCDHAFLVADSREAILIETAGRHWVAQEIRECRALVSVRTIRQDWDRISRGFSSHVIGAGAWPADGSKIDFVSAIADTPERHPQSLSRWARSMTLLQEQNGHIDMGYCRRLLRDHGDGLEGSWMPATDQPAPGVCRHTGMLTGVCTQASFLTSLSESVSTPPVAWIAFGPPCQAVYFPVVLSDRLPEGLTCTGPESLSEQLRMVQRMIATYPEAWSEMRDAYDRLQSEFEHCVDDFLASPALSEGDCDSIKREAFALMEHCFDRLEMTIAQAFEHGAPTLAFAPGT